GSLSNIPVYVEQANYGKLLLMTIESNSSHLEVEAMLEASFGGLFNDFDVNFDAGYNELLSESNISIQAIGGSLDWIVDTIPTTSNNPLLNWLETVAFDQTGMTAAPLFIQMAFLDDGSNANVVLATDEYIVRECIALPQQYVESIDLNNFRTNDPCNPGQHNPFEYICPIHVGGDRDFGGECNQTAKIELVRKNNNTELWVEVYFQVIEPNPDYTEGEAFVDQKVFTAPPGYFISSINSDHYSQIVNFYDDDHSVEIHNLPSGELVNKLIINGDNEGKDIRSNTQGECNCQQDPKAYLTIDFNQVDLTLREF
ncbi:MAG: thiol-activated cytolysin family protein, partial [Cyanobacteria bacterium J06649_11]